MCGPEGGGKGLGDCVVTSDRCTFVQTCIWEQGGLVLRVLSTSVRDCAVCTLTDQALNLARNDHDFRVKVHLSM